MSTSERQGLHSRIRKLRRKINKYKEALKIIAESGNEIAITALKEGRHES
jgi:hypothetical protein